MSATTASGTRSSAAQGERRGVFVTTHWSVVKKAGCNASISEQAALARLCEVYWFPLYAYVRQRGHSPEDAEDLTQEFFGRLIAKGTLAQADPNRGRFRSFLLASMNHFLAHEWEKAHAQKRGGNRRLMSLDAVAAERYYALEPADTSSPDKAFEKRWALALLNEVLQQLQAEYHEAGKETLFTALKETLTGAGDAQTYSVVARNLRVTETAVKVAVHRLRKRYRQLLRTEIARTVSTPQQAEEELRALSAALR